MNKIKPKFRINWHYRGYQPHKLQGYSFSLKISDFYKRVKLSKFSLGACGNTHHWSSWYDKTLGICGLEILCYVRAFISVYTARLLKYLGTLARFKFEILYSFTIFDEFAVSSRKIGTNQVSDTAIGWRPCLKY